MMSIIADIFRGSKTPSYLLVGFSAFVFCMIMPSFAAERTVSGAYTLTANENWTLDSVTLERGATVDLAGHNLAVGVVALGSGSGTVTFTDSSAGTGELRFTIPIGATFTKTADIAITGSLALVKDGPGTFLWSGGTLDAAIPITISGGVFKMGIGTSNTFGSSGTITINGTGQFDLNNKYYTSSSRKYSPVLNKTFHIEGEGPDGSGAIVNSPTTGSFVGRHLRYVYLTGDATIGGHSRIDFRDKGAYGINGNGHTLTVKNTACVAFCSANNFLKNCANVIMDGGVLAPCDDADINTISGSIILQNGGVFTSWKSTTSATKSFDESVSVGTGGGVIRSDSGYCNITGAVSVPDGNTLTIGNNTTVSGAVTGAGTVDMSAAATSVAGAISGFTGMIRVSGGTATIDNIATFPGTLALADGDVSTSLAGVTCGVVFDLSGKSVPFTIPASWLTLPSDYAVTVNLAVREVSSGEQLIAWAETPDLVFSLDATTAAGGGRVLSTADGLYYAEGDVVITSATWTGAANDGDFSNPTNWSCLDQDGNPIAGVVPSDSVTVTLGADVVSAWSSFDLTEGRTIDLNGHRLVLNPADGSTVVLNVTDTSADAEHPGELRFTVGADATFTSTEDLSISGNLSLVKDGPGTFVWGGGTLAATIPVSVTGGVFRVGVATANVFGAGGDIYVSGTGQFDINANGGNAPTLARTFHIEGDGPDGSGAIVNSASGTSTGNHLGTVILTGDATIGGTHRIDFRRSGDGLNGGGYSLTIKNTACLAPCGSGTYMTNLVDIVVSDNGVFQPCSGCTLGASGVIRLVNGGVFANWSASGVTQIFDIPVAAGIGGGTMRTDARWYNLNAPLTVLSGGSLFCTTTAPWYYGAITNETGATLNVSGEFNACGGIFRNDGTLNHTAGLFVFGHRDGSSNPCAVENNGTVLTSGGTFQFNANSSMTGTGTLELAGGSPQVLGDLSGFTGTVVVSNGVAITFTGINCGGTVAVYEGSTLTVDAESGSAARVANMTLADGSTLNIANYNGETPIEVVGSTTLPSDGKVKLKLNGGAFGEGIYAICRMNGVTAADGEKFAPLTSIDDLKVVWSVEEDCTLVLTVGDVDGNTWTGRAGDGDLSNPKNWYGGRAVPTSGTVTINTSGELTVGNLFSPDVIVFPETCGEVTIKGENAITGLTAITNLSVSTCTFEVPVAFADKICVSQGASYGFSNNNPVLKDGGKVRFAGGVTGMSFAEGTSRRLDGAFTIPATANWTANTSAELWTVTGDSSLTITDSSSDQPASTDLSWLNNNGAFTTAVIRTSARICVRNEGDYVVTKELAMTVPGADRHIAQRASHTGKYKFEKVTLGDNGNQGNFYFANSGDYYQNKYVYIGAGGLCFADGAQPMTAYAFGRRDKDNIHIYPWYGDYTIGTKGGTIRDIIIIKPTYFHTDDENGVARTVTLNGVADVRASLTVNGSGRFQVNSDGMNGNGTGGITVTDSATLAYAPGADLGAGAVTVGVNATMEIASGVNTFGGGLILRPGTTLAFNFTKRTVTPQIAIAEGKTLTVEGEVKVKIPADSKWPTGGEKVLTTCGGFTADKVSLVAGAPKWVRGLSVNADGNIVLDVKPMGTNVIVR